MVRTAFLCKTFLRYFGKVRHKSNVRIIKYDWLIVLYIFIPLVRIASFLIIKNICVWKEITDLPSFHKTQLQQITVEEHIFGAFALASLTFGPCTSTSDNFPFTYHFPPVPISISKPFNCSPIFTIHNFQRFHARSTSWVILGEEGVPIFESHKRFSPRAISLGVETLKHNFLSSSVVSFPSMIK